MKNTLFNFICALFLILPAMASAQNPEGRGRDDDPIDFRMPRNMAVTSSNDIPRFEIVTLGNETYRIDKANGDVWALLGTKNRFKSIERESCKDDIVEDAYINYQLILTPNRTYLMNLNSGIVWELAKKAFSPEGTFVLMTER